ncbi:hypothetical protein E2I00_016295 [Balaenoptera physalus]|uniref:Uncharacterized protein n=1 Tax=Balaenoptera physalus TaxID=9770 RepID=A0A643BK78_BALPH|nr:hypothetical protein E2I00_016295 [Balaenoptera physalus]
MVTFISVQLKKTSEVDLAKTLVKFIQQMYPSGAEEQAQYCTGRRSSASCATLHLADCWTSTRAHSRHC